MFYPCILAAINFLAFYFSFKITEEQIERWNDDPDKFVEDEDEDTFSYSVR